MKSTLRSLNSVPTAALFDDATGTFAPIPARTTGLEYREDTQAAYRMVAKQLGKVQIQVELRAEQLSYTRAGNTISSCMTAGAEMGDTA